jgi:hypothetical protein
MRKLIAWIDVGTRLKIHPQVKMFCSPPLKFLISYHILENLKSKYRRVALQNLWWFSQNWQNFWVKPVCKHDWSKPVSKTANRYYYLIKTKKQFRWSLEIFFLNNFEKAWLIKPSLKWCPKKLGWKLLVVLSAEFERKVGGWVCWYVDVDKT